MYSFKEQQISKEFRRFFLLQFTKELIKHSRTREIVELENILEQEKKELSQTIKKQIKEREKISSIFQEKEIAKPLPGFYSADLDSKKTGVNAFWREQPKYPRFSLMPPQRHKQSHIIKIPRTKLPPELEYLKPTPTNIQIDIGKLNPLVNDPAVRVIVCNGAGEKIIVKGVMGVKKTNIILSKQEIDQIIKKFSEITRIPAHTGIFEVAAGRLILSAIISDTTSTKFTIKKMMYPLKQIFMR